MAPPGVPSNRFYTIARSIVVLQASVVLVFGLLAVIYWFGYDLQSFRPSPRAFDGSYLVLALFALALGAMVLWGSFRVGRLKPLGSAGMISLETIVVLSSVYFVRGLITGSFLFEPLWLGVALASGLCGGTVLAFLYWGRAPGRS